MNTIKEYNKIYAQAENSLHLHEKITPEIEVKLLIVCETPKFLDYQKDVLQEFFAGLVEELANNEYEASDVKKASEKALQEVNTKLKLFAEKVRDTDFFEIKGFVQITAYETLISSMIGNTTMMIFRDEKLYYSLHNGTKIQGKIDLFSEFVEGELQNQDTIVYVGNKVSDILDAGDMREVETVFSSEDIVLIHLFDELMGARIEKEKIGFMSEFVFHYAFHKKATSGAKYKFSLPGIPGMKDIQLPSFDFLTGFKQKFVKNKYQATVLVLSVFIAFMFMNVLSQLFQKEAKEVFVNSDGVTVDLTIDDIKKDIVSFKTMDPTGDEKSIKYQEILGKLDTLEKKGRWLEDINQFKQILKTDYFKGFNIIAISDLKQFDDAVSGKKTNVITFNAAEKAKLGTLMKIESAKNIQIVGTKSALLDTVNDDARGALVEYNTDEVIKSCGVSLLKNGLYCYSDGKIYLISKAGVETVTTADPDGFPASIGGIATYGKANMYVFATNVTSLSNSTLVTRYRNTLGSQSLYQQGQKYMIAPNLATGMNFGSGFSTFAVDVNFLGRSNGKLYQFRRNPASSFNLDYREIKLLGGDKMTSKYSDQVKIITPANSKYVFLRDKQNKHLTAYESRPVKTNDQYQTNYNLYYLFRFSFDSATKVVDVTIPDASGDKPEAYLLSENGVNKIRLYEFIDSIKDNNTLKQVN